MVFSTYTVVDPGTVVVEYSDTSMTIVTMLGTGWFILFTFSAYLLGRVLLVELE